MANLFEPISGGTAGAFGNDASYFLGGRTRVQNPVSGAPQGRVPSARIPNRPGQAIASGQSPFPTSSQKPGNREGNQRIPYARMMFTWQHDTSRLRDMQPGDVVFLHKTSQAMGHGTNRITKCTGLPQLNKALEQAIPGATTLDYADPTLKRRVVKARLDYWTDELKAASGEEAAALTAHKWEGLEHTQRQLSSATVRRKIVEIEVAKITEVQRKMDNSENVDVASIDDLQPEIDWPAVSMLSNWTLDGVLINVDDEVDIDDTNVPKLGRDDGVLFNVCIQGPTALRNTTWKAENFRENHEYSTQHVDNDVSALDRVFVGLFRKSLRDKEGELKAVGFYFKLFSGRQLHQMHFVRAPPDRLRMLEPAPFEHGPSEAEFRRLVGAWRVGSVMDTKLTTDADKRVLLNVCVEWWTLNKLRREFDTDYNIESPEDSFIGSESETAVVAPVVAVGGGLAEPKVLEWLQALKNTGLPERVANLEALQRLAGVDADDMADDVHEWLASSPEAAPGWLVTLWRGAKVDNTEWDQNFGNKAGKLLETLSKFGKYAKNAATEEIAINNGLKDVFEMSTKMFSLIGQLENIVEALYAVEGNADAVDVINEALSA